MTIAYRLSSKRWRPDSGKGAALEGGRRNPAGVEVVYLASNPSLAALEILVHIAVPHLPADYVMTEIHIPDTVGIEHLPGAQLPVDWDVLTYGLQAQEFGRRWVQERRTAVLCVPSKVMFEHPTERNFIINPLHPKFPAIEFLPSRPFSFDPRLARRIARHSPFG